MSVLAMRWSGRDLLVMNLFARQNVPTAAPALHQASVFVTPDTLGIAVKLLFVILPATMAEFASTVPQLANVTPLYGPEPLVQFLFVRMDVQTAANVSNPVSVLVQTDGKATAASLPFAQALVKTVALAHLRRRVLV